jgi:hypothetical protein
MAHSDTTVWLQPAQAGCGGCEPSDDSSPCRGTASSICESPSLTGDPAVMARLLGALRAVGDADGNLVDARRISALRLQDGEAELTLAFPRGCGPARLLAEGAFHVLKLELPDTDVYVRHAA